MTAEVSGLTILSYDINVLQAFFVYWMVLWSIFACPGVVIARFRLRC